MTHLNIAEYQKRQITDLHLETVLETLDRLHTAATENRVADETTLTTEDLIGWLEDIIYTAHETINEINHNAASTNEVSITNIANLSALIKLRRG